MEPRKLQLHVFSMSLVAGLAAITRVYSPSQCENITVGWRRMTTPFSCWFSLIPHPIPTLPILHAKFLVLDFFTIATNYHIMGSDIDPEAQQVV